MSTRSTQIAAALQQGQRLHAAGRLAEADIIYRRILAANPNHADTIHMLGVLALQTGQAAAALATIDRALAQRPSQATFHVSRANALLALGRPVDAEAAARAAMRFKANLADAHQVLGHALADARRAAEAITAYRDALRLNPALPGIRSDLGVALRLAGHLDESATMLRDALGRAPADLGLALNLSSVLKELGALHEAGALLDDVLRRAPGHPVAVYNKGLLDLLHGRFDPGWRGFEARFAAGAVPARAFGKPQWDGAPLNGRRLLVHAEQGFGDMIQFARFLPMLDGSVVLEAPRPMVAVLESVTVRPGSFGPGKLAVVAAGDSLPPYDLVCPMMSLPFRAGLSPDRAPGPYLTPDPVRVARWRARLPPGAPRIGIAWQGNAARTEDIGRSFDLARFLPVAAVPGVRLISLQKGFGAEQLAAAPPGLAVESLGDDFDSGPGAFLDSAAVMASLDLVISSDTAIAHLAGALGRPVWVALRRVPDWRWMLDRADSPWYPSMRLFRQAERDDWTPVFAAMAAALGQGDIR